jgi:sugar transferase (PEP-CTERM/EpsH1 system associated)
MEILFLAHRIPFPPDKGDKIRSYRWLKALAARHSVHLGCFIDDRQDRAHIARLGGYCASIHAVPLPSWKAAFRAAAALAQAEALTPSIYRDAGLAAWVRERLAVRAVGCVVAFSSAMAGYVDARFDGVGRILDFVDVDAEKWRLLADKSRGPKRLLYRREAARLLAHDRQAMSRFDLGCFVSSAEADRFQALAPEAGGRLSVLRNGVDVDFFDPSRRYLDPYPAGGPVIAFTGAMNYAPNEDAAAWFAAEVLPRLRSVQASLRFAVVGRAPSRRVRRLVREGVEVVGAVADMRPYLAHAAAVVAPMRATIGVPNKILEALAMARPVVATPEAVRGLDLQPGRDLLVASGAEGFAAAVQEAMSGGPHIEVMARQGWRRVAAEYDWERVERQMQELVEETASARSREAPRRGALG